MARPKEKTGFVNVPTHQRVEKSAAFENRAKQEHDKLRVKVAKALEDDLLRLFEEGDHADLAVLNGGSETKAHRCILQARCRHLWQDNWVTPGTDAKDNGRQRISMTGLSDKQVSDFIRQLYVVSDSGLLVEEFLPFLPGFKDGCGATSCDTSKEADVALCDKSEQADELCNILVSNDMNAEGVEVRESNQCNIVSQVVGLSDKSIERVSEQSCTVALDTLRSDVLSNVVNVEDIEVYEYESNRCNLGEVSDKSVSSRVNEESCTVCVEDASSQSDELKCNGCDNGGKMNDGELSNNGDGVENSFVKQEKSTGCGKEGLSSSSGFDRDEHSEEFPIVAAKVLLNSQEQTNKFSNREKDNEDECREKIIEMGENVSFSSQQENSNVSKSDSLSLCVTDTVSSDGCTKDNSHSLVSCGPLCDTNEGEYSNNKLVGHDGNKSSLCLNVREDEDDAIVVVENGQNENECCVDDVTSSSLQCEGAKEDTGIVKEDSEDKDEPNGARCGNMNGLNSSISELRDKDCCIVSCQSLDESEVMNPVPDQNLDVAFDNKEESKSLEESDRLTVGGQMDEASVENLGNDDTSPYVKSDLSEALKNSYALSIPYETCSALGRDLLQLYLQQKNCDVCLSVDGVKFLAHKCVLAARCSYFSAMLGGRWCESDMEEIDLQGVSAQAIEQLLLFLYGGVMELCTPIDLMELFIVTDMYGVETLKFVLEFFIRKDLCHFFHKPCSTCVVSASSALNLCHSFYLEELEERCLKWSVKYFTKIWTNKSFASLPEAIHQKCAESVLSTMTEKSVLDVIIECSKLSSSLPRIKWTESILYLATQLMDSAIEYTSSHFVAVIRAPEFLQWGKVSSWKSGSLEEIFNSVIDSLPIDTACSAYQTLVELKAAQADLEVKDEDVLDLLDSMVKRCEKFLRTHISQVARSKQWASVGKSLQSQILENSSYIHFDLLPDPKPRPMKHPLPAYLVRPRFSSAAAKTTTTTTSISAARSSPSSSSSTSSSSSRPHTAARSRTTTSTRGASPTTQTPSSVAPRQPKSKTTTAGSTNVTSSNKNTTTTTTTSGQRSSFTTVRNHLASKKISTSTPSLSVLSSSAPSSSRNSASASSASSSRNSASASSSSRNSASASSSSSSRNSTSASSSSSARNSASASSSSLRTNSKTTSGSAVTKPTPNTDKSRSSLLSSTLNQSSKPKEVPTKTLKRDSDDKKGISIPSVPLTSSLSSQRRTPPPANKNKARPCPSPASKVPLKTSTLSLKNKHGDKKLGREASGSGGDSKLDVEKHSSDQVNTDIAQKSSNDSNDLSDVVKQSSDHENTNIAQKSSCGVDDLSDVANHSPVEENTNVAQKSSKDVDDLSYVAKHFAVTENTNVAQKSSKDVDDLSYVAKHFAVTENTDVAQKSSSCSVLDIPDVVKHSSDNEFTDIAKKDINDSDDLSDVVKHSPVKENTDIAQKSSNNSDDFSDVVKQTSDHENTNIAQKSSCGVDDLSDVANHSPVEENTNVAQKSSKDVDDLSYVAKHFAVTENTNVAQKSSKDVDDLSYVAKHFAVTENTDVAQKSSSCSGLDIPDVVKHSSDNENTDIAKKDINDSDDLSDVVKHSPVKENTDIAQKSSNNSDDFSDVVKQTSDYENTNIAKKSSSNVDELSDVEDNSNSRNGIVVTECGKDGDECVTVDGCEEPEKVVVDLGECGNGSEKGDEK